MNIISGVHGLHSWSVSALWRGSTWRSARVKNAELTKSLFFLSGKESMQFIHV